MWAESARTAIRSVGEILITLGLVLFLFCAYQLFYTNVVADEAMKSEVSDLHKLWDAPVARAAAPRAANAFDTADSHGTAGAAFAILHIPRLGDKSIPVLQGTTLDLLGRGVGHYKDSAMPGRTGNFAVAGHRKTHGEPFRYLDEMRDGDLIVVETADSWYTYREDRDPFIVDPTDLGVVAPVPDHPGATPSRKLITLTTCNPWWASTQRMIVTGELIAQQPRSAGEPPAMTVNAPKFQ
ncbi:sortase family protein [Catenulispora acidiphila DSM 44928]|uniref:Sortase family protein n=1 Tax=Catenulispora acidiphila (strain DSM 44928 / JCM 14897 / NBRC 102108 / NRRL B-24433 / ID139908) TaxID=479433 RepID=C7QFQ7_CATAD|nr:class E sortase [Catenulispora acidiphila]ACU68996.1 sortase family protein [Catenulispora acidiphila DSM 44928]